MLNKIRNLLLIPGKNFAKILKTRFGFVSTRVVLLAALLLLVGPDFIFAGEVLAPDDVLRLRTATGAQISPNSEWIAYTVSVARTPAEPPGAAYAELYLVSVVTGAIRPFITGKVNVSSPQWRPDGAFIAFLSRRDDNTATQVWMIRVNGGEATQVTDSETGVAEFRWHPSGKKIAYIATTPQSDHERQLEKKGYGFIFYGENLKHRNLYLVDVGTPGSNTKAEQLTWDGTVWSFEFNPAGTTIAAAISEKNLVDHNYMFQKIFLLDLTNKNLVRIVDNPGKLGNFVFSPDGTKLAYTAALERKDHAVSQVYVKTIAGGQEKNLTVPNFRGHVNQVGWKDTNTILYSADEGVWPTLSLVKADGGARNVILHAEKEGVVFSAPSYTGDFKHFAFIGNSPEVPGEVYYWDGQKNLKRLTNLNPWLAQKKLGKQNVIRYPARDGLAIEGLLIYPVDFQTNIKYPLVVTVHGGPESNYSNGWLTRYSQPGQVLAGRGYLVFYPNYRASTGYGVEFALQGYGDAAGKEFDDIADGIDYLVARGIADNDRVGLGGGSYGGYAAAWFASYYTHKVRAVCMFAGISNVISKRGSTDIPYEELYVHSGKKLEEMWDINLKQSPVYWAHQCQTAVLILGGTADTRVHPSQSLEFYNRLKINNHPAVRLVQYPGEGHGNSKQPGRIDVLYRQLDWYDWYVKDKKPLAGPIPPLDISDNYGLTTAD